MPLSPCTTHESWPLRHAFAMFKALDRRLDKTAKIFARSHRMIARCNKNHSGGSSNFTEIIFSVNRDDMSSVVRIFLRVVSGDFIVVKFFALAGCRDCEHRVRRVLHLFNHLLTSFRRNRIRARRYPFVNAFLHAFQLDCTHSIQFDLSSSEKSSLRMPFAPALTIAMSATIWCFRIDSFSPSSSSLDESFSAFSSSPFLRFFFSSS